MEEIGEEKGGKKVDEVGRGERMRRKGLGGTEERKRMKRRIKKGEKR